MPLVVVADLFLVLLGIHQKKMLAKGLRPYRRILRWRHQRPSGYLRYVRQVAPATGLH